MTRHLLIITTLLLLGGCCDNRGDFLRGDRAPAGEDDGDGLPADDDDDAVGGPGAGPGGNFGIWYWEMPPGDSGGDYVSVAGFLGSFADQVTESIPGTGGLEWNHPEEPDSCAATIWDADDRRVTGGTDGQTDPLHAGTITLSSPSWSVDLEPEWNRGFFHYGLELNPDYEVHFETYYELEATGATFPGFDSTAELLVPAPLHLLSPAPSDDFEVSDEDFTIEWVGGSFEELWLEFHNGGGLEYNNVQINCRPLNDGSFTIPGELLDLFEPQDQLVILLSQPRNVSLVVGEHSIDVGSAASVQASGHSW